MRLSFNKEDLFTVGGFVFDSYSDLRSRFEEVAPADYDSEFLVDFGTKRDALKDASGATPGSGSTITRRLYANMDATEALLNKLLIRLDLTPAADLSVAAKEFGLPKLMRRLRSRDAEGSLKGLATVSQLLDDNAATLQTRGYQPAERTKLNELRTNMDADNKLQNVQANAGIQHTQAEDADYAALDAILKKIMKTAARLFRGEPALKRQFQRKALLERMHAGGPPPKP